MNRKVIIVSILRPQLRPQLIGVMCGLVTLVLLNSELVVLEGGGTGSLTREAGRVTSLTTIIYATISIKLSQKVRMMSATRRHQDGLRTLLPRSRGRLGRVQQIQIQIHGPWTTDHGP